MAQKPGSCWTSWWMWRRWRLLEGGFGCFVQQVRDAPGPLVQYVLCTTGQDGIGSAAQKGSVQKSSQHKFSALDKSPWGQVVKADLQ
eukprot:6963992-Karenia_brevis.AAC.1